MIGPASGPLVLDTLDLPAQSHLQDSEKRLRKRGDFKDFGHFLATVLYAEACRCGDNRTGVLVPATGRPKPYERKDTHRYYMRMADCCSVLEQREDDPGLYTKYCKTRVCPQCARIMTGKNINRYEPVLSAWGLDCYFVTLTNRGVKAEALAKQITFMTRAFSNCVQSIRRTHRIPFMAIRKLEVTRSDASSNQYHPHFHLVVHTKQAAELLIQSWLSRSPTFSSPDAQNIQRITPGTLHETLKYATKIIATDPEDGKRYIDAEGIHQIVKALSGKKTLQPIGFRLPRLDAEEEEAFKLEHATHAYKRIGEAVCWTYVPDYGDWVDLETGEVLTGRDRKDAFEAIKQKTLGIEPTQPYPLNEDEPVHDMVAVS